MLYENSGMVKKKVHDFSNSEENFRVLLDLFYGYLLQ
jgi:hypothetical protein